MALPNIFTKNVADQLIQRIDKLKPTSQPQWGKMNVAQMLAHCNVTYEMAYENKHAKPNFLMGLILKGFVKKMVVNETPYKKNVRTAPAFIIADERDFALEKERLIRYLRKTVELGENHFDGRASLSFGKLSKTEWNNMFYKHLDHHLKQFGV
ncbi:DUF1569 domain-containing protein [Cyclobacterium jeungdonense]|uniref:DUF1569 domain-containing protein n=1 Tax=Cyclobacterium jeungdonense TaxID=708087 RepID=A0ABT8C2T0_9BACT|nr:DUF1569 domain-containing protein [Cyclobacterium jeungdonense]MDN3686352.1 DUF1569 domain-containing protein [Cyclobacterium jeungdonense]